MLHTGRGADGKQRHPLDAVLLRSWACMLSAHRQPVLHSCRLGPHVQPSRPSCLPCLPCLCHLAGHLVAKADLQAAPMAGVGCSCLEPAGSGMLLAADSRGCLHLLSAALHAGVLQRLSLLAHFPPPGGRYHEPSCLEFVPYSPLARGPAVLLALSSGEIALSRLHEQVDVSRYHPAGSRVLVATVELALLPGRLPSQVQTVDAGNVYARWTVPRINARNTTALSIPAL